MKKNLLVAGILGAVAAVLYFASMATYAFPGESAHLMAVWRGLDYVSNPPYPLMAVFAKALGAGNLIAPVCGTLAVVLMYLLVSSFVRWRANGEHTQVYREPLAMVAGLAASVVFMLTPAVRSAATHLEPKLFDFTWALLTFALFVPYVRAGKAGWVMPVLLGVMTSLGACDSALFFVLLPFLLAAIVLAQRERGHKPYGAIFAFVVVFLVAVPFFVKAFGLDMSEYLKGIAAEIRQYPASPGWLFVAIFSTLPFLTSLFSSDKAYNEQPSLVQWLFHAAMTFVSILAIATPLSPSSLMEPFGVVPVLTSAFAAAVAGHLVSYWWVHRRRVVGLVGGGVLVFVLAVTCLWNLFAFERSQGAFADRVAEKVLADLGDRKWFVSDGVLDDHLRLAAAKADRELNLVSLARDLDEDYLARLGDLLAEKMVGGPKNEELRLSLSLGVLPFVQDWFASDPSVAKEVAIYGAPDLWYGAGLKAVPEFLFFGADPARVPDWKAWKEFDAILEAPKGWGSYSIRTVEDPVDRMRLSIRRHLGLVANDRGVYLLDEKRQDEAFEMFDLVLNEIDRDNVCALFNEIEMSGAKHAKAVAKKHELERALKKIVDDKDRRYHLWRLGNYYGYIRNPDIFVRLGFTWARSGRPGDALSQIRRAIDFVPTDKRTALLNMMAALYASDSDRLKSRKIYESVLAKNADDHDALVGLMRLELLDGNTEKALKYLERAAGSATGPRANIELAMLAMMKGDFTQARTLLRKATDADPKNLQAWSLTAAVIMQQSDAAKDAKAKAALDKELANAILPTMEKQTTDPFNYYVQTTKAFLLMRQGESKRKEARDAFVAAAKARPDVAATQDIVLGLDISLDDATSAERHAREMLRRNRKAPLANYVMGSLALKKGDYREAEAFLRRSADAPKPPALALNDLAEVLRRKKEYSEAEHYARKATKVAPNLYVAWETLGSTLMDAGRNLDEAEAAVKKACELSKDKTGREADVRMLVSLARVQALRKDLTHARATIRKVQSRVNELSDFELKEFDAFKKSVR